MREADIDLRCIRGGCACSVTIALSKDRHLDAGVGDSTARIFQKVRATGSYFGTLVYPYISFSRHTRRVYGIRVLNMGMARFSEYELRTQVQGRQFKRITERLAYVKAICVVRVPFCACAFTDVFYYAKKKKRSTASIERACFRTPACLMWSSSSTNYVQSIIWRIRFDSFW